MRWPNRSHRSSRLSPSQCRNRRRFCDSSREVVMDPRISKQRTALVLDQPFFGALALRLRVIEDPSCKTFWTNGEVLGYNPAYLAGLNDLETRGVLAHEVLH